MRAYTAKFLMLLCVVITNKTMAEKLYSDINVLMPELANVGPHSVGVTTIEIDGPNLLLAPNGRKLTLEVWYPSAEDNISTRSGAPNQVQTSLNTR